MAYKVDVEELKKLQEDKDVGALEKLGGTSGLAGALLVNLNKGISGVETAARAEAFGKNYVEQAPPKTFLELCWEALEDPTLIILVISAVVSLVLNLTLVQEASGWIEGLAILMAVVIVVLVTAVNDFQRDKQFRRLNDITENKSIKVVRDGSQQQVSIHDVVVGDVVEMHTGDQVPADGVFLDGHELKVDESSMTGEPDPIQKTSEKPFLISGTQVVEGTGSFLVTAVGENSEKGQISALLQKASDNTPLQDKLEKVADTIGWIGVGAAVITFVVLSAQFGLRFYREDMTWEWAMISHFVDYLVIAITIVVVAVPEGLPLAVTISLAYSMMKMLRDQNLVRHLVACETMGGATNICSDKTGTLTENKMTVTEGWIAGVQYSSVPSRRELDSAVLGVLCEGMCINSTAYLTGDDNADFSYKFVGNTTECAMLVMCKKLGVHYTRVRDDMETLQVVPFSSARKRMTTVVKLDDKKGRVYCKGASEIVLGMCTQMLDEGGNVVMLPAATRVQLEKKITDFATSGLRTICLAYRDVTRLANGKAYEADDVESQLVCIGILGIRDPVRAEVPAAVASCKSAGIMVRMVTGDNILTAKTVARECGIYSGGLAMEGPEFRKLSEAKMTEILPRLQVLARSSPTDKHVLVSHLRKMGEVVAVTGDGTNDAPALKEADVGFSMGIAGTEVAKDASDIVLMDDNFRSIVKAVLWGRNVYDSIRKFLQFQLTVNVVALSIAVFGAISLGESPLTAVQLLWVNLIMDTFAALALATADPTPDLLDRPPYGRNDFLITKQMWINIIGQSIFQLACLFTFMYLVDDALGLEALGTKHMTLVFNTFVLCQVFNELNARRLDNSQDIFSGLLSNPIFVAVTVITVAVQWLIIEFGGDFTSTTSLTLEEWGYCAGAASLCVPWGFVLRALGSRYQEYEPSTEAGEGEPQVVRAMWGKMRPASMQLDLLQSIRKREEERMAMEEALRTTATKSEAAKKFQKNVRVQIGLLRGLRKVGKKTL